MSQNRAEVGANGSDAGAGKMGGQITEGARVSASGGSFPSSLPAVLGLAIDGVYASPGVGVKSWRTIGSAGSDHRAVVVDLVLE